MYSINGTATNRAPHLSTAEVASGSGCAPVFPTTLVISHGIDPLRYHGSARLILTRYIAGEVIRPLFTVTATLVTIFVGYSSARYLASAANGLLTTDILIRLILLKATIALEVLLPVALYLSVVFSLARLESNYELTAMRACGIGTVRVMSIVLAIALVLGIVVLLLSVFVRPWAYTKMHWIEAHAEADLDILQVDPGNFLVTQSNNRVVFVENIDPITRRMEGIFLRSEQDDMVRVTFASRGYQMRNEANANQQLHLIDAHMYEFDRRGTQTLMSIYGRLTLHVAGSDPPSVTYSHNDASTMELAQSYDPKDISELQWRFSNPISTVLLAILGVLLSHSNPRQSRHVKTLGALLVFAVYFNVMGAARRWVQSGAVEPIPGIWWVPALLGIVILVLILPHRFWAWRRTVQNSLVTSS